jgi:hypothetical protein
MSTEGSSGLKPIISRHGNSKLKTKGPMKTLKAWIVYGGSVGWLNASLILENGWVPFGHCCSHTFYMPGDLILERPKRQKIFEAMGYKIELQKNESGQYIIYAGSDQVPQELHEKWKSKIGHDEMEALFRKCERELYPDMEDDDSELGKPRIEIEVSSESH